MRAKKIYPELSGFYWTGQMYESLPALGRDMLERLWKQDKSNYAYWDSILGNKLLSGYLKKAKSDNKDLAAAVSALETAHTVGKKCTRDTIMNYYTMAYLLSGQKIFRIGERQFENVEELAAYMKELIEVSYAEFEGFCHKMLDSSDMLDVQLEAWLIALGKRRKLDAWRQQLDQ